MVLSDVPGCVLCEDVELFVQDYLQDYLQSNYLSCILPLLLCIQHARHESGMPCAIDHEDWGQRKGYLHQQAFEEMGLSLDLPLTD